ncbi:cyclic nucleotide-binding domain-containing protein [Aliiruegeria sabulilitoris]|uniref:cyclic nucleotide-binding domain-containing protein n=1 Tax=Aliiruegeria sabulilitoris TaxID=1510458 RepID=UPI00082B4928|nr:cyclic nucleotide-binding domain-containing protein [Aliiruegeria sabulilitoris]NDR54929.1 cyclic nucleotide-binding domain-containing protein [Pseudoruegeria sp. M32A2M]
MKTQSIAELLSEHSILGRFDTDSIEMLAGCARNLHFGAGEMIQREGEPAALVHVLRTGDVAIEISAAHIAPTVVETVHGGDILGWGWLIPPYRTMFDARAMTEVSCVALDAACLRGKCDADPMLGYQLFKYWLPHLAARFRAQRLQVADLYGRDDD